MPSFVQYRNLLEGIFSRLHDAGAELHEVLFYNILITIALKQLSKKHRKVSQIISHANNHNRKEAESIYVDRARETFNSPTLNRLS
jgi:hypothetical protein